MSKRGVSGAWLPISIAAVVLPTVALIGAAKMWHAGPGNGAFAEASRIYSSLSYTGARKDAPPSAEMVFRSASALSGASSPSLALRNAVLLDAVRASIAAGDSRVASRLCSALRCGKAGKDLEAWWFNAVITSQDPHARWIPDEMLFKVTDVLDRAKSGTGVSVGKGGVVTDVAAGSPASSSVKPGDRIVSVSERGQAVPAEDQGKALSSPSGDVVLGVRKPSGKTVDVPVRRTRWETDEGKPLASVEMDGNRRVLSVKWPLFYARQASGSLKGETVADELRKIAGEAGKVDDWVIDLRGNAGGDVGQVPASASLFAPSGTPVASMDFGDRKSDVSVPAGGEPVVNPKKVVVMVDGSTASAAELMAAWLQGQGACVVGRPTYGKGSVQEVFPLTGEHPWGGALVATVALFAVNGNYIQGYGVIPDYLAGPEHEDSGSEAKMGNAIVPPGGFRPLPNPKERTQTKPDSGAQANPASGSQGKRSTALSWQSALALCRQAQR